jgi:hypothetical protein
LSIREIAHATGRTETGVKVTLFRARQKLAARLGGANDGIPPAVAAQRPPALADARSLVRIHHPPLMTS